MTMVRKQVYITKEQDRHLKRLTKQLGKSEAELIRRGLDAVIAQDAPLSKEEAWKQFLASIEARAKLKVPQLTERDWKREDLYDDRPKYLSGGH